MKKLRVWTWCILALFLLSSCSEINSVVIPIATDT